MEKINKKQKKCNDTLQKKVDNSYSKKLSALIIFL